MHNLKYKIGDKVKIKSLDWYNENKDKDDNVVCFYSYFDKGMSKFCNKIVTIKSLHGCPNVKAFRIIEDDGYSWWSDDMIEGLVEEETENWTDMSIPDDPFTVTYGSPSMNDSMNKNNIDNGIIILPEGYSFKDENGNVINATKIVLEKKKKEYPKTYEECCKVLGYSGNYNMILTTDVDNKLFNTLYRLKVCRDAYWKLYGEEIGLRKPWEPDNDTEVYNIYHFRNNINISGSFCVGNCNILEFPTTEMRDTFYKAFKEEIEICKELL